MFATSYSRFSRRQVVGQDPKIASVLILSGGESESGALSINPVNRRKSELFK
jgi:hypothetical protein